MNLSAKRVLPLAIAALAVACLGAASVPTLPMPSNGAMIYNPGTGDYSGFRIVVSPDGRAIAIDGAGHASTQLENDVVAKFFSDLASAGPLAQLSAKPCTANVNAPTTVEVNSAIIISWKGQHSPALTCATDASAQRLLLDATQIQRALYVQAYRKRNLATYGTSYDLSAANAAAYDGGGYGGITFNQFYSGGFSNSQFLTDPFTIEHFSAENYMTSLPYSSPYSGSPYTTLPYAGLPYSSPFSSLPYTSPFASPAFTSPYSGSPFVNPGFSSPATGTGPYTTSTP
ncbi:MAG TPA: hypothetical protein VEJ41_01530 [Candidatus Acidoferrales bacterium]|nr:hypothetical protein [Candidatus Acidoferrales bacterium]